MDDLETALGKALRFLSVRPRSEKEVRDNLATKKVTPEIINTLLHRLKDKKLLDDEKFAIWWIEQRNTFRPIGKQLIKIELKRKGISDEIVKKLTAQENKEPEINAARELVKKRMSRYKGINQKELLPKLQRFLLSRGFSFDTIRSAIDEAMAADV